MNDKSIGIIMNSRTVWKYAVQIVSSSKPSDLRGKEVGVLLSGTVDGFLPTKYLDNPIAGKLWKTAETLYNGMEFTDEEYSVLKKIATDIYALYGESLASTAWWEGALRVLEQGLKEGIEVDMQSFTDTVSVFECRYECVGTLQNLQKFICEQLSLGKQV